MCDDDDGVVQTEGFARQANERLWTAVNSAAVGWAVNTRQFRGVRSR